MSSPYILTVVGYVLLLSIICKIKSRNVANHDDFLIGGRNISKWKLILTLIATWTGAGSLIGGAGLAYRQGFSMLWICVGAWIAILLVYKLAGRVRELAKHTLPDILEMRFGRTARILGSITLILGCTTIVGYQLKGGSYILELTAGIPKEFGILIILMGVIIFTTLGGMISITTIDVLNGVMIIAGLAIALPILIFKQGDVSTVVNALPPTHFEILGGRTPIWAFSVFVPVFLLLLGEPSMYQKFSSAMSHQDAKKAAIGWVVGIILVDLLICTLAVTGRAVFPDLSAQAAPERIILDIARFGLPVWAGCLLLAAALAIVFSTANSFLLAPATNLIHDIVGRFYLKNLSAKKKLFALRISIVLIGVLAYLLLTQFPNVLSMTLTAYTMIGASLTPAILAAFFWPRVTKLAGCISIASGMIGTILTKVVFSVPTIQAYFFNKFNIPTEELGEYIIIPAFLLASFTLIALTVVSRGSITNTAASAQEA